MGLLACVDLVEDHDGRAPADEFGAAVSGECLRRGLSINIVRSTGGLANYFRMAPPLSVTEEEIDGAISATLERRAGLVH